MSTMDKGRILLSVTGFNPQRWYELLAANRVVTLKPDGAADPTITYAVVWKHRPNLLPTLPNLRAIFSIGPGFDHIFPENIGPAGAKPGPSPNPNQFLTSDQCMGCHSGGTYGNVMLYTGAKQPDGLAPAMNVSPFGEWRWSAMGLAGRDPIFFAQLDSEIAFVKNFFKDNPAKIAENIKALNNTCFAPGVMGAA